MGLGTIVSDFVERIKELLSAFADIVKSNTRVVMIILIGFLIIVLLLLVLAVVSRSGTRRTDDAGLSAGDSDTIPGEMFPWEDFFLPYEPDFVPDVLLEREPRDGWTEEDARTFWSDPLEGGREIWRRRIESGIDSLLEEVP